jgi:hypothetical protein
MKAQKEFAESFFRRKTPWHHVYINAGAPLAAVALQVEHLERTRLGHTLTPAKTADTTKLWDLLDLSISSTIIKERFQIWKRKSWKPAEAVANPESRTCCARTHSKR